MRPPDTNLVVASTLLAVFTAMVVAATRYSYEARLVPLLIGIPAVLLAGWQLWRELANRGSQGDDREGTGEGHRDASRERAAIIGLVLFVLTVLAGGFVVGGTLAVMAGQRVWLHERWRTTAQGGLVAFVILYVFFERLLGLSLFNGWIAEWILG